MPRPISAAPFLAVLCALAFPAMAQQADEAATATPETAATAPEAGPSCDVTAMSEFIRVVVCDRPGSDEELAAMGRIACDGTLPCGTWFWTDPATAPTVAPRSHDGLSADQVAAALGVYVAEQDLVVRIERGSE